MSDPQSLPLPDETVVSIAAGADAADSGSGNSEQEMQALQAQLAELQGKLLRSHADLDNLRKRMNREQEEARKYESFRLIRDLLPGLDGLSRAADAAEHSGDVQNLLSGIRLVAQQFRDVLKQHAAEPIDALGKPFDPNIHEALTQIPSAEHPPMTVVQVVEQGYRLHDRVVRPARVVVSCAVPEAG